MSPHPLTRPVADGTVSFERMQRLVAMANRAPSGDNCQPWHFDWDGEVLAVRRDGRRADHVLDHDGNASRLALGCLLEALDLAAAGEGLDCHAEVTAGELSDRATWARVRFSPGAPPGPREPELLGALAERVTDRRLYQGGSPDHPVLAAIQGDTTHASQGVAVHLCHRFSEELIDYLGDVDGYVWKHEAIYRDVMKWMRFSRREVETTRDGVPWCGAGIDLPEVAGLRLARSPLAGRLVSSLGVHTLSRVWLRRQLASSAALVCITVGPEGGDLVAAGRLGMRAWLRLTHARWGVQPLTLGALMVHAATRRRLPPGTPPEYPRIFERGRSVLARAFGLSEEREPVWMFRTGISGPLPAHMRTLRLPVERLLSVPRR